MRKILFFQTLAYPFSYIPHKVTVFRQKIQKNPLTRAQRSAIIVSDDTVLGVFMKISAIVKLLKDIPLFSALDDTDISYLIKNSEIKSYAQGKEIIANDKITVILKGSVIVTGQNDGKKLLIRMLGVGNVSGVASLFSDQHNAISTLTAQKATEALIIPHATVETLIGKNPEFAMSYIRFLTSRIRFLNGKIKAYTVDSAEEKLALYLFM